MRALSKSCHRRWPSWAGGGDFRRCAGSALTHPATVAALGVLLLNDLLLKALWPHAWLTGKLSDLAWVVFALPLLAFLLSFAARDGLRARRLAFVAAYVGLPLLYAAFNTFDPVHDWIMRGISLAGGAAGSPRDATDSLVIPLAWAAALWVWRREPAAPGAMRLRWAVLVAGVAALASVATSYPEPLYGVQDVGISEEGELIANTSRVVDYATHWSVDGGQTWSPQEGYRLDAVWGSQTVRTPRGVFALDGPRVVLVAADGSVQRVVYSADFLEADGNVWAQRVSTEKLNEPREIATRPLAIAYDSRSGNLVLALGIQGVAVGTPDGKWTNVAVGEFEPTDFSFVGKTRLLLSDLKFWTAALALCVSMTAVGLTASLFRLGDLLRGVGISLVVVCVLVGLGVGQLYTPILLPEPNYIVPFSSSAVYGVPLALVLVALFAVVAPRHSRVERIATTSLAFLAALSSGSLIFMFGYSDDSPTHGSLFRVFFIMVAVATWFLAISSLAASLRHMARRWRLVSLSLTGMAVLTFLTFMLWLHLGVDEVVTKAASIALCGVAAIVLAGYAARTASSGIATCGTCGRQAIAEDTYCITCGDQLVQG